MKSEIITLTADQAYQIPLRLDAFLFREIPGYSRTYFHDLIIQGMVVLNDHPVKKPSMLVKTGDIIKVSLIIKQYQVEPFPVDFKVVAQHDDFLIIDKPAGLVVHQAHAHDATPTLVNGLLYYFKDFASFDSLERPGIVHRIDKDTSGLLLIAKNHISQVALSALFKERCIKKTYLAVVHGHPPREGTIDYPIGRSIKERHKMSHQGFCAREAKTDYEVLVYYEDAALVAARLITGRTHQIRVHFAALGYPLIGDATYGKRSNLIHRQALHAWKLSFNYREKNYAFRCDVPDDMKRLLQQLNENISLKK